MLRFALACLLLIPAAARADECDGLALRIAAATGGKVGRRAGPSIDIRVPGAIKLDLTCRAEPIVQATSAEPSPSAAFFRDLAAASEILVGEPAARVASLTGLSGETVNQYLGRIRQKYAAAGRPA